MEQLKNKHLPGWLILLTAFLCGVGCGHGQKTIQHREPMPNWAEVVPGDTVALGSYEQDGDIGNGTEPVEWIVLTKENHTMLLLSLYGLAARPYHSEAISVDWAESDLCDWLQTTFVRTVFSKTESDLIREISLLGEEEFRTYCLGKEYRFCEPTKQALREECYARSSHCYWWLRSHGDYEDAAACIDPNGDEHFHGTVVDTKWNAVRPIVWIEFE